MLEAILNKGAEPVRWLIVAAIAYTLATTIWTFFATPMSAPVATANRAADDGPTRPAANVNWILSKNLFGEAGAAPLGSEPQGETAQQTTLPLELQSVMVASEAASSTAIVAQRGRPGLIYHIGDKLPGNAELVEVLQDRIILRRAGVRESLLFPKLSSGFQAVVDDPEPYPEPEPYSDPEAYGGDEQAAAETDQADASASPLGEYRERLAQDAEGTLQELGIESLGSGGYRVGDVSASAFLQRTGLQPGDVILSVNGREVGDIQSDQLELDNIVAAGSARIEVQRGTRRFFITASLK